MEKILKNIFFVILIFLLVSGLLILYSAPAQKPEEISLNDLATRINESKVEKITVDGNKIEIALQDGAQAKTTKESEASLSETLKNFGVGEEKLREVKIEIKEPSSFFGLDRSDLAVSLAFYPDCRFYLVYDAAGPKGEYPSPFFWLKQGQNA
jgi:ATP-dependent Zn protease